MMTKYDFDIGIIGAGAAGLTVAAGSARLGARTLLIEKEGRLGGDCLHFGCVPSKTLISTARARTVMSRARIYGLPDVALRPVDFREVAARIQSVIRTIQAHDSVARFCGLGVKVEFGDAVFSDEHSVRVGNKIYSARSWVMATGSSPSIPSVPGLEPALCLTNRDLFSLERLPDSMIFLGAGPIAIEMAQAFCRLGSRVTVIQRSDGILTREDRDMSDAVKAQLEREGVAFHLDAKVLGVWAQGAERVVSLSEKGETLRLHAEALVAAAGRDANVAGLGLEAIGVKLDAQGIMTDNRMRTSQPHIYAAGDVTGRYQFTHAAGYEAGIVVSNAIFRAPRRADYTFLPHCTYCEPELAVIGMTEKAARDKGIDCSVRIEEFSSNDRSLAESEGRGRLKLVLDEKRRPIGVQILGAHAGELLSEWVAVLNGGMRLSTVASAVHPYPTRSEISKAVAGALLSERLFSEPVKKTLRLFFNLRGRACE